MRCGGGGGDGRVQIIFLAGSELKGRSIPYLSWSGYNHLYFPYVLMLYVFMSVLEQVTNLT